MAKTSVLKPGILVSLHTSLEGGVSYSRVDLDAEAAEGRDVARWETTRVIDDPAEHKRAEQARSKAGALVRGVCARTAFGLLCPETREGELDAAIAEARKVAEEFNATAGFARVRVYAIKGRIASTDEEAARAIASEVRGLLSDMENGVRRADAAMIRDAAKRAKQVGAVLGAEQADKIEGAIEAARKAAREIVKRVAKDGEDAQAVIRQLSIAPIEQARAAFLDLDDAPEHVEALPPVDAQRAAELDIEPDPEPEPEPVPSYADALDLTADYAEAV